MSRRALLIINPISGTLPKDGLDARVRERLGEAGYTVEAVETTHAGHGAELAEVAAAQRMDAVIVAGGDGTVNEVGTALAGSETAMGILPFGSGNGLARHLYGSIDIDHALDIIALGSVSRCDYGSVNGRDFFCTFGLGFDAQVSREFAQMSRRGLASYIKGAMQEWVNYTPTTYQIRTGAQNMTVKAFIVAVCNASQYGNNAFIAPKASVHDGLLDITIIHEGNQLTRALAGVELFTGRLDRNILIQTLRVKRAIIRHLPGPAHIDGDPCTMPETMIVECHPGGLMMFTDPHKPPFRPFFTLMDALRSDSQFLLRENLRLTSERIGKILKPDKD